MAAGTTSAEAALNALGGTSLFGTAPSGTTPLSPSSTASASTPGGGGGVPGGGGSSGLGSLSGSLGGGGGGGGGTLAGTTLGSLGASLASLGAQQQQQHHQHQHQQHQQAVGPGGGLGSIGGLGGSALPDHSIVGGVGVGGLGGVQQQQVSATGPAAVTPSPAGGGQQGVDELLPLVVQLTNPEQREGVLLELSKKRESFSDLAPILWHTYGTVAALLQEIVSIYPLLSPPTLTAHASNRVCNALALLQCVASHPDTRSLFLSAHVPLYLYPFLNTQSKSRPFEYLRLTSLGVIGALVKMDDADVINFLLQTEIIPLCLRIMETGSELSKTVATFIVQKILLDEIGLGYVCATAERFYAVSTVLNNMIGLLVVNPSVRLLKHIVRCYLRLSDNVRAREALKQCLPTSLRDDTFVAALRDDVTVRKWLSQLLAAVGTAGGGGEGAGGNEGPVLGGPPAPSPAGGAVGGGSAVDAGGLGGAAAGLAGGL